MQKAFQSVEFKVVIDMFMTDTAASAYLVLSCTTVLEEEDIFFNSMFSTPKENTLARWNLFYAKQ